MTTTHSARSLAEDYPVQQARVRHVLEQYKEAASMPHVNCSFAIAMIQADLIEAERAAVSGDPVRMLRAYKTLKDIE
jgi:hypothetical protein